MSFDASVLRVMIASPSDVATERKLIQEVIHEWNAIHAEDRKVVLLPVGWELGSSPQMGERPQALINQQLLRGCDILIAAFWTRIGTPTGVSASGTVEEIEEHLAAGREAMIYFSSVPVRQDSVDPDQYRRLTEFRKLCQSRGLIAPYDDLSAFRSLVARNLAQTVIRILGDRTPGIDAGSQRSPPAFRLGPQASELLKSAAGSDGTILALSTLAKSLILQADDRDHVQDHSPREEALWRDALKQLQDAEYIEDRVGKGQVFQVTTKGYAAALMH